MIKVTQTLYSVPWKHSQPNVKVLKFTHHVFANPFAHIKSFIPALFQCMELASSPLLQYVLVPSERFDSLWFEKVQK